MGVAVIAGVLALVGAGLGVLLEPLKNRFTEAARARQSRVDYCEALIRATAANRAAVFRLNDLFRRTSRGEAVEKEDSDEAGRRYAAARLAIRESILLIYLTGPDRLVKAAERVRESDRELRSYSRSQQPPPSGMSADSAPLDLQSASDRYEEEVRNFAVVARTCIR